MSQPRTFPIEAPTNLLTLLIDNYDSYTYNLFQQIAQVTGREPLVVRNDELTWAEIDALPVDNIVISPGPGSPDKDQDFGICAEVIRRSAVPVLGVCLGHQGIVHAYGGSIVRAPEPMHGRVSRVRHDGALFDGLPQDFQVVRYHSLVAAQPLPDGVRATAWAEDGTVMGLEVTGRPVYGVQFHPESILTEFGHQLIRNFNELSSPWRPAAGAARAACSVPTTRPATAQLPSAPWGGAEVPRVAVVKVPGTVAGPVLAEAVREPFQPLAWLDSAVPGPDTGRFSYFAVGGGPTGELVRYGAQDGRLTLERRNGSLRVEGVSVFEYLNRRQVSPVLTGPVPFPFTSGYLGWLGYEAEAPGGPGTGHRAGTDDAAFLFADRLVVVDHEERNTFVLTIEEEGSDENEKWQRGTARTIAELVACGASEPTLRTPRQLFAVPDRDRGQYIEDIEQCQVELTRGETYEICLTNRFSCETDEPAFDVYRRLRATNPAPYAAFLDFGDTQVACSSPERFLKVDADGTIEAKPIKGTARRSADPLADRSLAGDLERSVKDRAENLMIVDLLRNDLGQVCEVGTVGVPSLMAIESYATVHQMVSTVRGTLAADATAVDGVRSCFPGGSMTGAPKRRTMEIITRLEPSPRGVYSGAIGYVGLDGVADFNIVIRTIVFSDGRATVGSGGAITVLSDPEAEWQEIVLKAEAVLRALGARIAA